MTGMLTINVNDQKRLKAFLDRRHPEYAEMLPHWTFLEQSYRGGREWFRENVFRYYKEGDKEWEQRLNRTYRFNHTREVVDLVGKYIFKGDIVRNEADAPVEVREFWQKASLTGLDINQFMPLLSAQSSIYGRVWCFVESNKPAEAVTRADERSSGARVYAYTVKPQNVLDLGLDMFGDLTWILVRETARDDVDPIDATGEVRERFRLWTRSEWLLFELQSTARARKQIVLSARGEHNLGRVPAFPVDHVISENRYSAPALIQDIAYLDRAVANYLSNLDAIIQDQTFSQLAMPAQATMPGEDKYEKLLEMGTKRVFLYDGEGGQPMYLSPDPTQARIIIEVINKIINEIYHTVGMAGERTKQDNSVGIDNSSGVAKAFDFERLNSLLASKALSLDKAENEMINLIMSWHGKPPPERDLVSYPDNFNVRSLINEFDIAQRLTLIDAPEALRREQMQVIVEKLFPRMAAAVRTEIERELKSWPTGQEDIGGTLPSLPRPADQRRQGQVTANTP